MKLIACFLSQGPPYTFFPQFHILCTGHLHLDLNQMVLLTSKSQREKKRGLKRLNYFLALYPMCLVPSKGAGSADVYILESI